MQISQIIESRALADVIFCTPGDSVREAVAKLASKRIGAMPVMDGDNVRGIFSERDVIYRLADEGALCLDRPVGEVMTSPAITAEPGISVDEAQSLMTRRRIRHLPVVADGKLCGFISIGDLVKSRIDEVESEAEAMRSYIQSA